MCTGTRIANSFDRFKALHHTKTFIDLSSSALEMFPVVKRQHGRLHHTPNRGQQNLSLWDHIRKIHPKKEFTHIVPLILDKQTIPSVRSQPSGDGRRGICFLVNLKLRKQSMNWSQFGCKNLCSLHCSVSVEQLQLWSPDEMKSLVLMCVFRQCFLWILQFGSHLHSIYG